MIPAEIRSTATASPDNNSVRGFKAFLLGWLLPSFVLVVGVVGEIWLAGLTHTARTYGPFTATMYAPYVTPIVVVANSWVYFRKWRTSIGVTVAALTLPSVFLIGLGAILFYG